MPERPLLVLPSPGPPADRRHRPGGGGPPHLPTRERQAQRLEPRFTVLQQALDAGRARLRSDAVGLVPEQVIVLETVGPVGNFVNAVRRVDGLEWLWEVEREDIPPDEDFYVADHEGAPRADKALQGRLFLVFSNQQALRQLLSLWDSWKLGRPLPRGLRKWDGIFSQLRDVRPWGVADRLEETGVLEDWRDRVDHGQEAIPCEIELWFRHDERVRVAARDRVRHILGHLGGEVLAESIIEEIAYHALLARLPVGEVRTLLGQAAQQVSLVQCEQIQFLRAAGQMAGILAEGERSTDYGAVEEPPTVIGEPVVALFDGLPLQNHRRLVGRLIVDDPDDHESRYQASDRRHGTAMASLILHGDLDAGEPALNRRLYVRPILQPDPRDWRRTREEAVPQTELVVDLLHRAVKRLFEGSASEPAVAPQICVINLSIGLRDRLFDGRSGLSPLARLLDWLAWKYKVLFVVSAGNHTQPVQLGLPRSEIPGLTPGDFQALVVRAVALDNRHRRLLLPAEAVNAITVASVHDDASSAPAMPGAVDPYVDAGLPSMINAQGMGHRRAVKPEIQLPGGRVVLVEGAQQGNRASFDVQIRPGPPGQRVAAPGPSAGDLTYTWHTRGTSNATALASRAASSLYDVLQELRSGPGGDLIDTVPYAVWLKTLLVHGATWGTAANVLERILGTRQYTGQFSDRIVRLLGYGAVDAGRVRECTERRVTALGGGFLQADQAHVYRFPLPPSLSGQRGWRRLIITLAWLTPVNLKHQAWRCGHLWFTPPWQALQVSHREAHWQAVQRGTVQHEVMDGESAVAFVDGQGLEIQVNCRSDAGVLEQAVPYALATTLEVAQEIGVDIYDEISLRIHAARVQIAPAQ